MQEPYPGFERDIADSRLMGLILLAGGSFEGVVAAVQLNAEKAYESIAIMGVGAIARGVTTIRERRAERNSTGQNTEA